MVLSTADAMLAATSCNTLLTALDRLEQIIHELSKPPDDCVSLVHISLMLQWVGDARGTVLDIKSRL